MVSMFYYHFTIFQVNKQLCISGEIVGAPLVHRELKDRENQMSVRNQKENKRTKSDGIIWQK